MLILFITHLTALTTNNYVVGRVLSITLTLFLNDEFGGIFLKALYFVRVNQDVTLKEKLKN